MLTRDTLNELNRLTKEVNDAKEIASELLRTAQDRYNAVTHKLTRDGQEIELTEKVLWDEVFYMGVACQAGEILQKAHPEVFDMYKKQDTAAAELRKYTITEIGLDYTALSLSDYLSLTEMMVELLLSEKK